MNCGAAKEITTVLHVIATLDRAGTEIVCLGAAQGLAAQGATNRVVALYRKSGSIVPAFEPVTGAPEVLPEDRRGRLCAFGELLDRVRPDAIVFHFFTVDHVLMSAVARRKGIRRIGVVQGNPASTDRKTRAKLRLILWASRRLRLRLISVSRYIEDTMAELGSLPAGSTVIHNGCDIGAIASRAKAARSGADPTEAVVLMVARLDPIKDHATLIRALALMPVSVSGRRVVLELVGEGSLRADLVALAAAENVADRVRFLGARSDIPELLGGAAVFCLSTTRDEGFGVVLIEALAAGCPVVATHVPACAEVLDDGKLGRLCPEQDPEALASHLIAAMNSDAEPPPTLPEIAKRYDIKLMANGYLEVLFDRDHTISVGAGLSS
ncbi:MAG: glycosyltransferase [Maritimibacter sp.]|uniref:glycosyltransferase n=1 Tax=Maritimibacter sp. TaxID=2003363 RepID=UPI001DB0678E|nr:glycosyltransferase [Maritimibacter sp.]MBL6427635.1 glycosyltransferase [Maritimibacter sp.]